MRLSDFLRKFERDRGRKPRIGFIGLGISNRALLEDAAGYPMTLRGSARIDQLPPSKLYPELTVHTGERALEDIEEDILLLSPSVRRDAPELIRAAMRGVVFTSDAELFFLDNSEHTYAVSGSDGKSTTATMMHLLLKEKHPRAELLGNIGTPFADSCSDVAVAELSSFQLEYMRPRVRSAVLTPITENHLDWHADLDEYLEAKLNLFAHAGRRVCTPDTPLSALITEGCTCDVIYSARFSLSELSRHYAADHYMTLEEGYVMLDGQMLLPVSICGRREPHNIHNLMGAVGATLGDCSREHILSVAASFRGLEHRIERFLSVAGADFINSSIDTTPSRTARTLTSLDRPVRLILGGRGKRLSLVPCFEPILRYATRISLYGDAGKEYYPVLKKRGITELIECQLFERLAEATEHATTDLCEGDTVLLSPAATGYGEFRDFADRGRFFKKYILDKYKTQICERTKK